MGRIFASRDGNIYQHYRAVPRPQPGRGYLLEQRGGASTTFRDGPLKAHVIQTLRDNGRDRGAALGQHSHGERGLLAPVGRWLTRLAAQGFSNLRLASSWCDAMGRRMVKFDDLAVRNGGGSAPQIRDFLATTTKGCW